MNQHISSTIHTNNFDYTATSSNQNSSSAVSYDPILFIILETSFNVLHFQYLRSFSLHNSSLRCIFKNGFIHCFYLTTLLYYRKKITLPVPIHQTRSMFYLFPLPPPIFFRGSLPQVPFLIYIYIYIFLSITIFILWRDVTERKGVFFLEC